MLDAEEQARPTEKRLYRSWTLWTNLILLGLGLWVPKIPPEARTALITSAITNVALRLRTVTRIKIR